MQCPEGVFLCKLGKTDRLEVTLSLVVHNNFSWQLSYRNKALDPSSSSVLKDIPATLCATTDVVGLLELVHSCQMCVGNPDMQLSCNTFMDATGLLVSACILVTM